MPRLLHVTDQLPLHSSRLNLRARGCVFAWISAKARQASHGYASIKLMSQRSEGNVVEIHGMARRFHFSGSVMSVTPCSAWSGFSLGVTRYTHFAASLQYFPVWKYWIGGFLMWKGCFDLSPYMLMQQYEVTDDVMSLTKAGEHGCGLKRYWVFFRFASPHSFNLGVYCSSDW